MFLITVTLTISVPRAVGMKSAILDGGAIPQPISAKEDAVGMESAILDGGAIPQPISAKEDAVRMEIAIVTFAISQPMRAKYAVRMIALVTNFAISPMRVYQHMIIVRGLYVTRVSTG